MGSGWGLLRMQTLPNLKRRRIFGMMRGGGMVGGPHRQGVACPVRLGDERPALREPHGRRLRPAPEGAALRGHTIVKTSERGVS